MTPEDGQPSQATASLGSVFLIFLRLGATGFGGPAKIRDIRSMVVDRKQWLSAEDFKGGLALCQAVPGATGMQISAYIGLKERGFAGAAVAYVGYGLSPFVAMLVLSVLYLYGHNLATVQSLFTGLQAIVIALVFNAALGFGKSYIARWWQLPVVVGALAAFIFRINPIFVIVGAGVVGLLLPVPGSAPAQSCLVARAPRQRYLRPLILLLAVAAAIVGILFVVDRELFSLTVAMLRIDLFAFGGGFTSVPLMQHEFVDVRQWVDTKTFLDGIALGQVTPGPIVVTATFVGFLVAGFLGAFVATLAIFLPSFVILVLVQPLFERLRSSRLFNRAIQGALLAFVGLLLVMTYRLGVALPWDWAPIVLALAAFAALRLKVDVLWVIVVGAGASLLLIR